MPHFTIDFTRVIRISGRYTIKAKDADAAEEKAEDVVTDILGNTTLSWSITTDVKHYTGIEWGTETDEDEGEDIHVQED